MMGETEMRRTLRQVLNYSALCHSAHHLSVAGMGIFHINADPLLKGVDVVLDTPEGEHLRIDFSNLESCLGDLIH